MTTATRTPKPIRVGGTARRFAGLVATGLLALLASLGGTLSAAEDAPDGSAAKADEAARVEFFEKSVRPLLVTECGGCHGEKKQWAGLRLDSRPALLKGGESGAAVVPGRPDESLLIAAVKRESFEMPPDKPLTAAQVGVLERWVREGAVWPASANTPADKAALAKSHWAFQPVRDIAPPAIDSPWARTPVDRFILEKLAAAGLAPAPEADRRTLIRRVTYDLTGLPPTPEEVDAFVADESPGAYERLVDRLLDSPRYGEQWGRHWLDVARYSDTKGYVYGREERFLVQAPAYRDWVVRAFQTDLPYDRFLLLQIAADQVSEDSADVAAMGYLTVGRRFLGVTHDIIDDRIDVVTRGTMGLTVGCARCHDHKYDPIPTADYYALYGVFQNCTERLTRLGEPAATGEASAAFEAELKKRQQALADKHAASRAEASRRVRDRVADYLVAQTELEKYPEEGFDQIIAPTDVIPNFVRRWQGHLANRPADDPVFAPWKRFAALPPAEFAAQAPEVAAGLAALPPGQLNERVRTAFATPPASMRDVAERYGKLFAAAHEAWKAEEARASTAGATPLPTGLADPADEALRQVLYGPGSPCDVPDEPIVTTEYFFDSGTLTELWRLQGEVDRWIINSPQAPPFGVAVVDRAQITEPCIFRRGNPATKGDFVPRQFLSLVAGPDRRPFARGSGRLELAQAIVHPQNPLTARVWVNRVWTHHFGAGLVPTPSDFGIRAGAPSHPELLDWLARRFVDGGWSTKALHRLLVTSAVYRQASSLPDDAAALAKRVDPENRLLSRMKPHRLSFEELRDTLLAVTGELDTTAGGRASDLLAPGHRRRTLYGLIDRQFLPGILRVFDFANPDLHTAQRSETTVPQQALFMLNHPFMAARARGLVKALPDAEEAARLEQLYQRLYQRAPTPPEREAALAFLAACREEAVPSAPVETTAWQYGVAAIDPQKTDPDKKTLGPFRPLGHFTGSAWQGEPAWPGGPSGWAQLTATGGHPGNDLAHAVVRRWTAPAAGTVAIAGTLVHEPATSDGVRGWIISSRQGVLKTAVVRSRQEPMALDSVAVEAGETIDFVVDILGELNSDQHLWAPAIRLTNAPESHRGWDATRDFHGPPVQTLTPWEQLAQVLLASNELMFVD